MNEDDYWHLENLMNLDQLPTHGFKLSVFPVKWIGHDSGARPRGRHPG